MRRNVFLVLFSAVLLVALGFFLAKLTEMTQTPALTAVPPVTAAPVTAAPPTPEPKPVEVDFSPEPTPEPPKTWTVTEYKSEDSERFLWDCLTRYAPNEQIAAGILAMFWRESSLRSDATAHWSNVLYVTGVDQPAEFTAEIDSGLADGSTRESFAEQVYYVIGGYGLGQWYGYDMLLQFYDFAQSWGTSIADAEMQCAFTVESLRRDEGLWADLLAIENPRSVGWTIAVRYDGTSLGSDSIAQHAEFLYNRYHVEPAE